MSADVQPTVALSNATVARGKTPVLEGVTVALLPGQLTSIIGPNGSGKSTVLRALARLEPLLAGEHSGTLSEARPSIGWLSQRSEVSTGLPLRATDVLFSDVDALTPWLRRHGSDARERAATLAKRLGVTSRLQAPLAQLSGGERQKIELARTFSIERDLLLLDEPMSALDIDAVHEVEQLIAEAIARGATVVVATHDLHAAAQADQVVLCRAGGAVVGKPDTVLSDTVLAGAALEHFRWSVH